MSNDRNTARAADFKLERYKHILVRIDILNQAMYRFMGLFQALATTILGGVAAVLIGWQRLEIDPEIAKVSIRGLLGLLTLLSVYVVASTVAGIGSWFDSRREEVQILDDAVEEGFRSPPSLGSLWRWFETYFIAFTIILVAGVWYFAETQIMPLIRAD